MNEKQMLIVILEPFELLTGDDTQRVTTDIERTQCIHFSTTQRAADMY
jgi:hypothetical protein